MDEYVLKEDILKYLEKKSSIEISNNSVIGKDISRAIDVLYCDIDNMTPADVQPVKRGRWIEQRHTPTNGYNYNVPYSTYVCSSCGLEIHNDEYSKYVRGTYTNCPVCTARMDGEQNDTL